MFNLTPDEETFLLRQPEVAALLAKFNKASAMREVSHEKRMIFLDRFRMFEVVTLPRTR